MTKKPTVSKGAKPTVPDDTLNYTLLPELTQGRLKFENKPLVLTREALLLNYRSFDVVRADPNPFRRGLTILAFILAIVLVARGAQLLFGFLTTPRFDIVADQVLDRVTQLEWYAEQTAFNPDFASQFNLAYDSAWQLFRALGGYPSPPGTLTSLLVSVLSLLGGWLLYGAVAHLLARWFGGTASYKQFLGPLALSYAPALLVTLEFIPGLAVAGTLIYLLTLVTKFIAIRRTYGLSPAYSLVVLIAPYIIAVVALAILVALGLGFGLGEVPYLNPILQFFTR